jgi:predicted dehydrogenase
MNRTSPRVAIVGASGIGKNHAGWFAKNGAEVVAFLGSSDESILRTGAVLQQRLGHTPRGYSDVEQLLQSEELDTVCIASPPEKHFEHATAFLHAGIATLCEKPLVYDAQLPAENLNAQAQELVDFAAGKSTLLGTQMQYATLATTLCELAGIPSEEVMSFEMEMETKNMKPGRSHETIWIELAPHPLSVLQKVAGRAQLEEIECTIDEQETRAHFFAARENGQDIEVNIVTRCNPQTNSPLRRFKINGVAVDYSGRKNAAGDFLTYLCCEGREVEMPDLVNILIANFLDAVRGDEPLLVTGKDGARNVEWMMEIMKTGRRI